MSENLKTRLPDCDNHYTTEELYDIFGMDENETKICLKCKNCRTEGGIMTCKYLLEGINEEGDE